MANKLQLTVTNALVQLKLYEKRIVNEMGQLQLITVVPANLNPTGFKSDEEFKKKSAAQMQSLEKLIENRDRLKAAIIKSNAVSIVDVGGKSMTVAEAIEKKSSIAHLKSLLAGLDKAFKWADDTLDAENRKLDAQADAYVKGLAFPPNTPASEINETRNTFIKNKCPRQVYVESIKTKRDELRKDIENFEANVDVALSVSNATTIIDVEL